MNAYPRPGGHNDFQNAREYELHVASRLAEQTHAVIARLNSQTLPDLYVPAVTIDVKEKRQKYGRRVTDLWPTLDERDMFMIDEMSVRRMLTEAPTDGYFLIRDVPGERLFIAAAYELACTERVRADRETAPGRLKGKWVVNLAALRRLPNEETLLEWAALDQENQLWKQSPCVSPRLSVPKM